MQYGESSATWTGLLATGAAGLLVVAMASILLGAAFDDEGLAKQMRSMHNLRNLGMANAMYAAEWADNQYTPVPHNLARYGSSMEEAFANHRDRHERELRVTLKGDESLLLDTAEQRRWLWPVTFDERPVGSFRMVNVLYQYANGGFHDEVFYAPHDSIVHAELERRKEGDEEKPFDRDPESIVWSSYVWSPAARYSPIVLSREHVQNRGFSGPFADPGGFRVPTFSQCRYPDLKTHLIEHHWLQNPPEKLVNEAFGKSRYEGGEPRYFNHGRASVPHTAFYDGHVSRLSIEDVMSADAALRLQNAGNFPDATGGLWLRSPGGAINGYYENMAVDDLRASPHTFTTDGIIGRDLIRH